MAVYLQSENSAVSLKNDADMSLFSEVLLVAKDEESSREDRRVLRRTGFRGMQFFSSGVDIIRYILTKRENVKSPYSCLVICHEQLSDMDASTLVSLLRLHPQGSVIPVLTIITPDTLPSHSVSLESYKEKYKLLGVFDVLMRPLTPNEIFKIAQKAYAVYEEMNNKSKALAVAVEKASESLRVRYNAAEQEKVKLFELTIAKFIFESPQGMSYEEAYNEGCEKLKNKLYEHAWRYFKRAIAADSPYKADALFALYQLYKERQESSTSKVYLIQACQAYIDDGAWDRVEECVKCFSQEFSKCPHPILGIITTAIKRSDVEQLDSLLCASKGSISCEEISRSIVTGCFHYELSPEIMRVLSSDVDICTRVLELLQERRLNRQTREQGTALDQASLAYMHGNSNKINNSLIRFSSNEDMDTSLSDYLLSDSSLLSASSTKEFQHDDFYDVEILDDSLEKQAVRLGVGSKGSIESLPLVVLSERNKGSFLSDVISIAKQTAKIYRKSR